MNQATSSPTILTSLLCLILVPPVWAGNASELSLHELGFEQLMDMEVSTAARKDQPLSQTPAAAYVITNEDIRRSGATNIPEALRLAPGVAVAQISASKWSVSIRGFSGRFANKLLVLIDGRTVYTPVFSGVYWENNDLLLEDVERIEVIRGPGATLWGANAVNGIINIITRSSTDTQGALVGLGVGSEQNNAGGRWGGSLSDEAHLRLYAKATGADSFQAVDGSGDLADDYQRQQGGFRADWTPSGVDQVTLQGDLARMDQGQSLTIPDVDRPPTYTTRVDDEAEISTANLLARWERSLSADSEIRVQAYLDYYKREEFTRDERVTTFDLDLQHRFGVAGRHDIVWGLAYRYTDDNVESNPEVITGRVQERSLSTYSGFIQDEIELVEDQLWLTLGTKVEHNDLTGVEWQPNIRAIWTPDSEQSLWGSIARAVRTPSFGERDYRVNQIVLSPFSAENPAPLPVLLAIDGNPDFGSEELTAFELGYRRKLHRNLTLDAAVYYNDFDRLLSPRLGDVEFQGTNLLLPTPTYNDMEGASYGAELTLDWHPAQNWRIQPNLSLMQADFRIKSQSNLSEEAKENSAGFREGSDPEIQFSLRTGWSPRADLDLDLWVRYVSELPNVGYPSRLNNVPVTDYWSMDIRTAWRPQPGLELAITGKNLLESRHLEYIEEIYPVPAYVPRSVFATLKYEF